MYLDTHILALVRNWCGILLNSKRNSLKKRFRKVGKHSTGEGNVSMFAEASSVSTTGGYNPTIAFTVKGAHGESCPLTTSSPTQVASSIGAWLGGGGGESQKKKRMLQAIEYGKTRQGERTREPPNLCTPHLEYFFLKKHLTTSNRKTHIHTYK